MFDWLKGLLFGKFYKAEGLISQAKEAYKRYSNSHKLSDLEKTVECYRSALAASSENHDKYPSILVNLSVALTESGNRTTVVGTNRYSEPIELLSMARRFIENKPERPSIYITVLISLGRLYLNRYRENKEETDLQASIGAYEHVRSSIPSTSLQYCTSLIENAAALWTACELQSKADDALRLEQALTYLNEARDANHDELEGECYKHLAAVHDLLYRGISTTNLKKAMTHLNSAIEFNQRSLGLLRSADAAYSPTLVNLARQQYARYTASMEKNEDDMRDAEMNCQKARTLAETEHASKELLGKINQLAKDIERYKKTASFRRGSADQH